MYNVCEVLGLLQTSSDRQVDEVTVSGCYLQAYRWSGSRDLS